MKFWKSLRLIIVMITLFQRAPETLAATFPIGDRHQEVRSSSMLGYLAETNDKEINVPSEVPNLQEAINLVGDEGKIVLAAGTYMAPTGGFRITDTHKRFTIKATSGASVILSGGGVREILRIMNTDITQGGPVVFHNISFANGYSNSPGIAAGVTLHRAEASFVNCVFTNNSSGASGVGGGITVGLGSTAFFIDSTWQNNSAVNYGGGLAVGLQSKVYIHRGHFLGNRTNLPNHSPTSAGGAIHVSNSLLRVSNSRFENNQAGYVGGGIYAIGTWTDPVSTPQSDVVVSNSTFVNNLALRDATVSYSAPTEGGAFHAEGQTTAKVYHSRFINNNAMAGGAITIYQAIVEVDSSTFLGNSAKGQGNMGGYGGAISVSSNDVSADGSVNRRSASLNITSSYFQGRYGTTTTSGYGGGGIYISGDFNRTYGANGVSQMGTAADNRSTLVVNNVVFNDLDVVKNSDDGVGGAILADLTEVIIQNSLIMNSEGMGTNNGSGGGLAVIGQSLANVSDVTFARNSAGRFGGAVFVQGSTINLSASHLFENSVGTYQYGSALFTTPMETGFARVDVSGIFQNNKLSNNSGLPIFDDDRTNGPINSVVYNNNDFFTGSQDEIIYTNAIYPYGSKKVSELNTLVVQRANGTSTVKSQVPNRALTSIAALGKINGAPAEILTGVAVNDPDPKARTYIAYAWSGNSATLNGNPLADRAGVMSTTNPDTYTLVVDGHPFSIQSLYAATPELSFTMQAASGTINFSWSVTSGTFLENQMNQGVRIAAASSGSVQVPSSTGVEYSMYGIMAEGGVVKTQTTGTPSLSVPTSVTTLTGLNLSVNLGYIPISNSGAGILSWTAQSLSPDLIQIQTPNGQIEVGGTVVFRIITSGLNPGQYVGYVQISGEGTTRTVTVTVYIAPYVSLTFVPSVFR